MDYEPKQKRKYIFEVIYLIDGKAKSRSASFVADNELEAFQYLCKLEWYQSIDYADHLKTIHFSRPLL